MLMCAGEAPTGLLGGSLFEREIYQKLSLKIIQKYFRVRRSAHLFLGCPSGRNLTESIQNQTESWGSMPDGILMSRRSSSGNYSKLKTKLNKILMLMRAGEAPTGLLGESLFEREIIEFHSTFSRHGNAQASLTLLIWLNEKVQKLSLKINQKLYLGAPVGALFFLGVA